MDYDVYSGTLWNGGSSTALAELAISCFCYARNCLTRLAERQGGIDPGGLENPMTAAVRELREETGITSARLVALVSGLGYRVFPSLMVPFVAVEHGHSPPCSTRMRL